MAADLEAQVDTGEEMPGASSRSSWAMPAWVLATRTAVCSSESDLLSQSNPVPLVHAPREIRINALKRFRSLEMH